MRTLIAVLFTLSLNGNLLQAQLQAVLLQNIVLPASADRFSADQFGNIFLVVGEELLKLNPEGKEQYSYSDPLYGDISSVDALTALNPLIFYSPVNQLRILDNRLNQAKSYNLMEAGFIDPTLIAYSDEEHIWFYDQAMDRLVRYEIRNSRITNQSLTITQITEEEGRPSELHSSFNRVLLRLPKLGAMIFDAQGSFIKTIPIPSSHLMAYSNKRLVHLGPEGELRLIELESNREHTGTLAHLATRQLLLRDKKLYLLDDTNLKVYRIDY